MDQTVKIAVGVAIGLLLAVLVLWVGSSVVAQNNEDECLVENVERAKRGEPALDCG